MSSKSPSSASAPQWAFRTRLRRGAFGWRGSRTAIARIDEALAEIRAVARKDSVLAAEGAVLFLESLGDRWGELCVTPERASRRADTLLPTFKRVADERKRGVFAWFKDGHLL
jgi:hypothetical protein